MIRQRAAEGKRIYLADPETGETTEEWLMIRSRWCDEFQEARARAMQSAFIDTKTMSDDERKEAEADQRLSMVASLVGGWSFDAPFTVASVKAFLREAPQIVEQIDKLAVRDSLFFRKASGSS